MRRKAYQSLTIVNGELRMRCEYCGFILYRAHDVQTMIEVRAKHACYKWRRQDNKRQESESSDA